MMAVPSRIRLNIWREIAILMIIIMEVCWITPWFKSLTPQTYAVDSLRLFLSLIFFIILGHIVTRSMEFLHLKKSVRQVVIVIILIIFAYLGVKTLIYTNGPISFSELISRPIRSFGDIRYLIPVEFIVVITVLLCFWRGVSIAHDQIGPSSVMTHFWIGIVMFIAFILLITMATGENSGEFFYIFLFSTLVGVSSARMSVVGMIRGGNENRFNRSWFIGIISSALIIVAITSVIASELSDNYQWIGGFIIGLFGSIVLLIWVIINPIIAYLLTKLSDILQNSQGLTELGKSLQNINNLVQGLGAKISNWVNQKEIGNFISKWGPSIKSIIFLVMIALVVAGIILWMAFKIRKNRERRSIGDEEKSKINNANILQPILDMFLQGWKRTKNSLQQLADFKGRRKIRVAARIRQIYADLLDLCDELGQPRPDAATPLEFIPKIEQVFPNLASEVELITRAYVDVRYGLLPETQDVVDEIENAWKNVEHAGKVKNQVQKQNKKVRTVIKPRP